MAANTNTQSSEAKNANQNGAVDGRRLRRANSAALFGSFSLAGRGLGPSRRRAARSSRPAGLFRGKLGGLRERSVSARGRAWPRLSCRASIKFVAMVFSRTR
jgi:hypothetical protein